MWNDGQYVLWQHITQIFYQDKKSGALTHGGACTSRGNRDVRNDLVVFIVPRQLNRNSQ